MLGKIITCCKDIYNQKRTVINTFCNNVAVLIHSSKGKPLQQYPHPNIIFYNLSLTIYLNILKQ